MMLSMSPPNDTSNNIISPISLMIKESLSRSDNSDSFDVIGWKSVRQVGGGGRGEDCGESEEREENAVGFKGFFLEMRMSGENKCAQVKYLPVQ
jgi:hypothetical protein